MGALIKGDGQVLQRESTILIDKIGASFIHLDLVVFQAFRSVNHIILDTSRKAHIEDWSRFELEKRRQWWSLNFECWMMLS